jgi:serine/threonine-protein kinase
MCEEPLPRDGAIPVHCPFSGEIGCPQCADLDPPSAEDPLAETIAYDSRPNEADGFPLIDDLTNRPLGQYLLGSVIGRGCMGRVYRAEHTGLGRTSALKIMNPSLVDREPQIVDRFWAEARAIAGLVHPNIVTVHNLGSDRGYHYIEMEYISGGLTLKERLVREGSLDALNATTLVRQVALALGMAHKAGLVHRDVKPANVLLAEDGCAKLADFGLVRRLADLDRGAGQLAGTPTFMAPELFTGASAGARTDLYAVGVMYYYLLTARLPFAAEQLGRLIRLHRQAPVPDVRRLAPNSPDEVAAILNHLLAKDPDQRYDSADDLADDLRGVLGHLRDTDSLVRESLDGLGCFIQGGRDRFRVIFPVGGDRIQEVYIDDARGRKGEPILSVYSVCAPADPQHYEYALKLNAELAHGSLSIREVNGQEMFVMARTFARGHVTAHEIRAAVMEIARRGDRVEQHLTSTDLF